MRQPIWNFEQEPANEPLDETGVNLRGNFRDDGNLMMFCCERDVEVDEYRRVLEKCIEYRNRVREKLLD